MCVVWKLSFISMVVILFLSRELIVSRLMGMHLNLKSCDFETLILNGDIISDFI